MEALRERFGKYHVLEKLAQGGMAEVYKVKTVGIAGFEKLQALKRILPRQARDPRFIRSFIDEARIAVELTHRNIVQVFDFGKADGELFLAMELIEGKDLRTALAEAAERERPPPETIAAYIVGEVASGLDYAHRKADLYGGSLGIVHCDVSPSNVMLSTEGDIKILDFGIARATFASALERRRLRGKPRYMAPEQTFGETPTAASDVFALGIIAWELMTGLPLYRGADLKEILEAVRRTNPPRVDRINPRVPRPIADAIATALDREPARRGGAAELAAACARTAMLAGPRALARWLAELEELAAPRVEELAHGSASASSTSASSTPSRRSAPWETAAPGAPIAAEDLPPPRPTETVSLRDLPVPRAAPATTPSGHTSTSPPPVPTGPPRPPIVARPAPPSTAPPRPEPTARLDWGDPLDPGEITATSAEAHDVLEAPTVTRTPVMSRAFGAEPTATEARPFDLLETRTIGDGHALALGAAEDTRAEELDGELHAHASDELLAHASGEFPAHASGELPAHASGELPAHASDEAPIDDDLGAIAAGALAERRRIVVVAATLAGAPPDALRPITKSLGELAYQRGGVVLELRPGALVVAFGLEVAGEDDVAIAMGWALDAAAMARDTAGDGEALEVRIGARAGVVTSTAAAAAAPVRGAPTVTVARAPELGPRIPGEAVEQARALAREAAPDRPLFVGGAGRLTSGLYALRELPQASAAARDGRVTEVLGPRGFDERDRARLERRGKLIGRTVQLAELDLWYQRALAAERRIAVLVTGAAGVGKSRLVAELVARRTQADPDLRVITTAAGPAHRLAPFSLVVDLYQAALGLPPGRGRRARAQVVARLQRVMLGAGFTAEHATAITMDLDRAMELRDGLEVAGREAADLRPRVSAGLAAVRAAVTSRAHPSLIILEDVHLADTASLEVVRHMFATPAPGPELVVLTARPDGPPPPPVDAVIPLGDLAGGELRALITDRLGAAATPKAVATVLARGGGNPLFVEELAQAVRDAGSADEDVPATARDVVSARVDRLAAKARTALRYASVLGGRVRARLLEELLGEASLGTELDELVAAGFLVRSDGAAGSSEGELAFARGLVREVVYESLSARAQRDTHARVGQLLASRFFAGREEPPATIAEHLERGGELAGAAAFWLRAGRLAMSASDAVGAAACFTRTLHLERELGDRPPTATSLARRREALAGRDEAHRLQGSLTTDPSDLDELERLCAGEPARLADVALRRAQRLLRLGDYERAREATRTAEGLAATARDDRLRGEALRLRGEILERLGRFDEALAAVGDARELFHRRRAVADEMAAMVGRGRIHLMRAHYEAARDAYRPVLARIAQTGDPWLERVVKNHVAVIEMCLGNFAEAMRCAQRSLELCRRYGDRSREGDAQSVAGIILLEVGLYDQAATLLADALALLARTNSRWSHADCLIYAGTCEQRRGKSGGLRMLDQALEEARQIGARYLEANALIARAGAHLRAGALRAAIADAAEGTEVARRATLVGYEIQGLARHALALTRLGRPHEATALVLRALELLDTQRYLEGSEEEVLVACATALRAAGAPARAERLLEQARGFARRKLAAMADPEWRAAFAAIPEIAQLVS